MPQYKLIDNNSNVVNVIVLEENHNWQIPENYTLERIEDVQNPQEFPLIMQLSQLEFLKRFTSEERVVIRSSKDPIVEDFMHIITLSQNIQLDDSEVIKNVNYLEQQGILTAGRAAEILKTEII